MNEIVPGFSRSVNQQSNSELLQWRFQENFMDCLIIISRCPEFPQEQADFVSGRGAREQILNGMRQTIEKARYWEEDSVKV